MEQVSKYIRLSVRTHGTAQLPLDGFRLNLTFHLFIFRKSVEKIELSLKSDKNNEYFKTFSHLLQYLSEFLLRIRNISNKSCRENQNTHFIFSKFSDSYAGYAIMSKKVLEAERPQTIWRLRVACWISKATRTQAQARAFVLIPTDTRTHAHTYT